MIAPTGVGLGWLQRWCPGAAEEKPLSACSGVPRGVVLHAVSTHDAGRRKFGGEGCATWEKWCGGKQLPQP